MRGRFFVAKQGEFFCCKAGRIFFSKQGDFFGKREDFSVPNLTFEREEEVKGVDFGGQTFARP